MVPFKGGKANEGHSCVKGRFAWGYATHADRITKPMIREAITDPWREVSWDEAIGFAAAAFKRIQATYGRTPSAASPRRAARTRRRSSSRSSSARLRQQQRRHLRSRLHSPTGYGLKTTFGTSAGTQVFKSVEKSDVVLVIGANPTDGHPVFASRLKKRLRQGARLIVVDPRRIDLVESPHIRADHHLQLMPGTNVALVNAWPMSS